MGDRGRSIASAALLLLMVFILAVTGLFQGPVLGQISPPPGGGGGGSGTVTSVSVTTANGVSGTVASATTTPAISLSLGAITPTSVVASGAVSGSNLSGTNTGDQTSVTGNAGTATALQTARTINGVSFNGTADVTVPAAAGTLTGATLNSSVTGSSLTSVGTLTAGTWSASTIALNKGGTGATDAATAKANLNTGAYIGASCGGNGLTSGSAVYCGNFASLGATESARRFVFQRDGRLKSLVVATGVSTPDANATCRARLNGVDQTPSLTLVSSGYSGPGFFAVNLDIAVTRGTRLTVSCTGAGTTQFVWDSWSVDFQ